MPTSVSSPKFTRFQRFQTEPNSKLFLFAAAVILVTAAVFVATHTRALTYDPSDAPLINPASDDSRDSTFGTDAKSSPNRFSENEAATQTASLQRVPMNFSFDTEREGFEPSNGFKPVTAFPVLLLRPLGHLSKELLVTLRQFN